MSAEPKPRASLVADAKEELRRYLADAPSPVLLVALEDFRKVKRLHNELFSYFRVRFTEDVAKWPMWARGASLPMQRVLIGARKRVTAALVYERERRNPKGGKDEQKPSEDRSA